MDVFMWIILKILLYVCMYSVSATPQGEDGPGLRCKHPACIDEVRQHPERVNPWHTFRVEDHKLKIVCSDGTLKIICKSDETSKKPKWQMLDSPALPQFTNTCAVNMVTLSSCAAPDTNSFAAVLKALNAVLLPPGKLVLYDQPSEPILSEKHFKGLEQLIGLAIYARQHSEDPIPTPPFLTNLQNLRSLILNNVKLATGELNHLSRKLRMLWIEHASAETLPKKLNEALSILPNLKDLTVDTWKIDINYYVSPEDKFIRYSDSNSETTSTEESLLEKLMLVGWAETHLTAIQKCDNLHTMDLQWPLVETLPARWVEACHKLLKLEVTNAKNLVSLPADLLEGATSLKLLTINGALQSLPEGIFKGAPNLLSIDLSHNQLRTIPSDMFLGLKPTHLMLKNNLLENSAVNALAKLTSIELLELQANDHLDDLCDNQGYSPLKNLTELRVLFLSATNISNVCRDWREDMLYLSTLDLRYTLISKLAPTDLQFIRKSEHKDIAVLLLGTPLSHHPPPMSTMNETTQKAVANDTVRFNIQYDPEYQCHGCQEGYMAWFDCQCEV